MSFRISVEQFEDNRRSTKNVARSGKLLATFSLGSLERRRAMVERKSFRWAPNGSITAIGLDWLDVFYTSVSTSIPPRGTTSTSFLVQNVGSVENPAAWRRWRKHARRYVRSSHRDRTSRNRAAQCGSTRDYSPGLCRSCARNDRRKDGNYGRSFGGPATALRLADSLSCVCRERALPSLSGLRGFTCEDFADHSAKATGSTGSRI
jgi:hypothetical protein